ncbi:hypothetical protein PAHAL_2G041300 [Panicum hallii]|jgi:hypothetical protein|uniref:Uncharacterized protein n=1 Tax=Panicum hallii TaxID=206008 RepID=A0A2S3GVV7_9POAL|nr:hypothetical protein PAHAL_2G041300 [Panicum hallii]
MGFYAASRICLRAAKASQESSSWFIVHGGHEKRPRPVLVPPGRDAVDRSPPAKAAAVTWTGDPTAASVGWTQLLMDREEGRFDASSAPAIHLSLP